MARFLDANIFLRFLRNDDPIRSPACKALFQTVEQRQVEVWTSDLVIAEVVFVLSNKRTYNVPRADIATNLLPLVQLRNLRLANKRVYRRVFELYTALNLSYVDCYNAALGEDHGEIEFYTYDEGFRKIPSITPLEPPPTALATGPS